MDLFLKGNGHWCPDCEGTGRGTATAGHPMCPGVALDLPCGHCLGIGRLEGPGPDRPPPVRANYAAVFERFMRGPA